MSAGALAWVAFAAFLVALAARVAVSEVVRPDYRLEIRPRRVVRCLDLLVVLVLAALLVALGVVVGPTLWT